jgi:hypothetical protein
MSKLTWIERPITSKWLGDRACYEAEFGQGRPPYRIRERVTNGKTFFMIGRGMQHYTTVRSLERAKAFAEADYETANKS